MRGMGFSANLKFEMNWIGSAKLFSTNLDLVDYATLTGVDAMSILNPTRPFREKLIAPQRIPFINVISPVEIGIIQKMQEVRITSR